MCHSIEFSGSHKQTEESKKMREALIKADSLISLIYYRHRNELSDEFLIPLMDAALKDIRTITRA